MKERKQIRKAVRGEMIENPLPESAYRWKLQREDSNRRGRGAYQMDLEALSNAIRVGGRDPVLRYPLHAKVSVARSAKLMGYRVRYAYVEDGFFAVRIVGLAGEIKDQREGLGV